MEPVTIMLAVQAVSALAQMYTSEKAAGASRRRLDEMKRAFDALVVPNSGITIDNAGTMDPKYLSARVAPTDYNMANMSPMVFEAVGQYKPEAYQMFMTLPNAPYITNEAGEAGKSAQLSALQRLQGIASGETPDANLQEQLFKVRNAADQAGQQRQDSILQGFERRNMLGAGSQQLAQLQAAGDVTNRQAQGDISAAAESYRNRLGALSESAQLGGNIKNQERQHAAGNADLINEYNRRMSTNYQDTLNRNTSQSNQAQVMNLNAAQGIANRNVESRYSNADRNQRYGNEMLDSKRNQEIGEQQRYLGNQQTDYQNRLSKLQGQYGISKDQGQQDMGYAAQRNSQYQGLGDAVSKYAYYDALKSRSDTPEKPIWPQSPNMSAYSDDPNDPFYYNKPR